jgi:hypothetical protein
MTDRIDTGGLAEQRYEPLPGIDQLPAWLWRRSGPKARIAVGLTLLAARAAAEQRERAARHAQTVRALPA